MQLISQSVPSLLDIAMGIIFSGLQVADWWTTTQILNGGGRELNPVLARAFDYFGVQPTLIATKIACAIMGLWLAYAGLRIALIPVLVLYIWVVYHNLRQIKIK